MRLSRDKVNQLAHAVTDAVAGMDEVHASFHGEGDDAGDVEVSADGAFVFADEIRFIGLEAVDAEAVFLRVNGDGAQAQFGGGAKDADGNLAAIGHEQFFKGTDGRRRAGPGGGAAGRFGGSERTALHWDDNIAPRGARRKAKMEWGEYGMMVMRQRRQGKS